MVVPLDHDGARRMAQAAIRDAAEVNERLLAESFADLWCGFAMLRETFASGGHLHVCGNGGSAADAQHFAAELVVRLDAQSRRRPLPATALTTDTSILTAAANDFGFDQIFARQLVAGAKRGDLLLLLSTSGNSPNLLEAATTAGRLGVRTLALLGKSGGRLAPLVDCRVVVPSDNTQRIQEAHDFCLHLWCEWLEGAFPLS